MKVSILISSLGEDILSINNLLNQFDWFQSVYPLQLTWLQSTLRIQIIPRQCRPSLHHLSSPWLISLFPGLRIKLHILSKFPRKTGRSRVKLRSALKLLTAGSPHTQTLRSGSGWDSRKRNRSWHWRNWRWNLPAAAASLGATSWRKLPSRREPAGSTRVSETEAGLDIIIKHETPPATPTKIPPPLQLPVDSSPRERVTPPVTDSNLS